MRHSLKYIIIILAIFIIAQLIGIGIINNYDNYFGKTSQELNIIKPEVSIISHVAPEPIEIATTGENIAVIITIIIAFAIAVGIFLLLAKINLNVVLKIWFAVVVFLCLSVAFSLILYPYLGNTFIKIFSVTFSLAEIIGISLAIILTIFKIFIPNNLVHNITELFIYGGIAAIFVPILNVWIVLVLLILISIYDFIAVNKSKFMVKMAKHMTSKVKVFAGVFIPYTKKKEKGGELEKPKLKKKQLKKLTRKVAILGGGDIAWPLLLTATVFLKYGLFSSLIIVLTSSLALLGLMIFGKKKFYPAMPFITAGCFVGFGIVLLLTLV